MRTDQIPELNAPHPWIPEEHALRIAILSKLIEELSECSAIAARCLAQGLDESHPVSGLSNRIALEEELGDVDALIFAAVKRLRLNYAHVCGRSMKKQRFGSKWFDTFAPESTT